MVSDGKGKRPWSVEAGYLGNASATSDASSADMQKYLLRSNTAALNAGNGARR
jgi:hypothetical protein